MLKQPNPSAVRAHPFRASRRFIERQHEPRFHSGQRAHVGTGPAAINGPEPAIVWDVAVGGVGLIMASAVRPEALVRIDFENEAVAPRLAHVVRTTGGGDGWIIGCALLRPFSAAELQALREPGAG